MSNGWIGVDLDGTLAVFDGWRGPSHIGEPIPDMVDRVKVWLAEGREVRIFTARIYAPPNNARQQYDAARATLAIQEWCSHNIGATLPVTCIKDFGMIEFWDDRAVQVVPNTGERAVVAAEQGRL
jgi:hypothetical protein